MSTSRGSKRERAVSRKAGIQPVPGSTDDPPDVVPLSAAQLRELERRLADSRDRSRYLLASVIGPRFVLYYDVAEDSFVMNDPRAGTLFKRRAAAAAVAKLLRPGIDILPCRVDNRGRLVLRSATDALHARGTSSQRGAHIARRKAAIRRSS